MLKKFVYNSIKQLTTVTYCYILLYKRGEKARSFTIKEMRNNMHIIVNNSSMVPIYEQIMDQIKEAILHGELSEDTMLPSVRGLAKELKISALTVKKAYDNLEEEGFTVTVHGKGTFVAAANQERMKEEWQKEVEKDLEQVISKGRHCGLTEQEMRNLFEILISD